MGWRDGKDVGFATRDLGLHPDCATYQLCDRDWTLICSVSSSAQNEGTVTISDGAWRFQWGSAREAPSTVPGIESALPKWQLLLSLAIALWNSMVGFKCSSLKDWTEKGFVTEIIQDEVWSTPRTFENSDGWDTAVSYPGCCPNLHGPPSVYRLLTSAYDSVWSAVSFRALTSGKQWFPHVCLFLSFHRMNLYCEIFLFWKVIYVSFHKGTYI